MLPTTPMALPRAASSDLFMSASLAPIRKLLDDLSVSLIAVAVCLHVQLALPNGEEYAEPHVAPIRCVEVDGCRRDPSIRVRLVGSDEESHAVKPDLGPIVRHNYPSQVRRTHVFSLVFKEIPANSALNP